MEAHRHHLNDPALGFDVWVAQMQRNLSAVEESGEPLFLVNAPDLPEIYLGSLPLGATQYHNCACCLSFIRRYGSLATLNKTTGALLPVLWSAPAGENVPEYYRPTARALWDAVSTAKVKTPFMSAEHVMGTPDAGGWAHFAVTSTRIYDAADMTAGQAMAAKRESFAVLRRALSEYTDVQIKAALHMLQNKALDRPEKVVPKLKWFRDLKDRISAPGINVENTIWYAIGAGHTGLTNIRSGMVAFLLNEIKEGTPQAELVRKFNEKMKGDTYQRPVAAPKEGNVLQAQKLVENMGLAPSFERRLALLSEVHPYWTQPAAPSAPGGGKLFDGLITPKASEPERMVPRVQTSWEKVAPKLADAKQVKVLIPQETASIVTLTTAVHADAKPILRWDKETQRNPVDWFYQQHGTEMHHIGLKGRRFINVPMISEDPAHWHGNVETSLGRSAFFFLEGAKASPRMSRTLALFPESLRPELHAIRRTVEAHSSASVLAIPDGGTAHAVALHENRQNGIVLRITDKDNLTTEYVIDRWE